MAAMCKPYLVESFSRSNSRKFVKGSFVNNHTEEDGTCVGREKNGSLYSQTEFLRVLVRVYRARNRRNPVICVVGRAPRLLLAGA